MDERMSPRDEQGNADTRGPVVVSETVIISPGSVRRAWGPLFAAGVIAVIFGVLVLANIWASLALVTIFAGLFLVFAGIVQFAAAIGARRRGGRLLAALVTLTAGIVVVLWPEGSLKTLAVLVGISFVIGGVVMALASLRDRAHGSTVGAVFGAILAAIGAIVVVWPGPSVAVLMVLVGVSAVLFGISAIIQGLALRRA